MALLRISALGLADVVFLSLLLFYPSTAGATLTQPDDPPTDSPETKPDEGESPIDSRREADPAPLPPDTRGAPPPPSSAPPPYSIPWQLRPVVAPTVVRSDTSFASYENARGDKGLTIASLLTASYRIPGTGPAGAGLAPVIRATFVTDSPPTNTTRGGAVLANPLVGLAYAMKLAGGLRLNAFFGATVPVGGGGGDKPFAGSANSRAKGVNARAQMDNALFAVNDFTLIPGFGAAYVGGGLTVQAEITLLHLMRVRGEGAQAEASKTNLTTGLHVGYFVLPELSIGAELRYQRWLNPPFAVENDKTDASRDTLSFAVGPRAHFTLGGLRFRPGVAYQRGLDKPLAAATPNYHIVQLDLPLFF